MAKKKLWLLLMGVLVIMGAIFIQWFYFSKPAPFPTEEQLIEEMNSLFSNDRVTTIQDILPLDERHVLVPIVSSSDDYGLSYWVWQKRKWEVVAIDTKGEPTIWQLHKNDPSSYHFVWNIHPEDQLGSIEFYLVRDRNFRVSMGVENYTPRIQMMREVSLKEQSYGIQKLPDEWVNFLNTSSGLEAAKQPDFLFASFFPNQSVYFGWLPKDFDKNDSFPERSVNSHSFYYGNIDLEDILILDERSLEQPTDNE